MGKKCQFTVLQWCKKYFHLFQFNLCDSEINFNLIIIYYFHYFICTACLFRLFIISIYKCSRSNIWIWMAWFWKEKQPKFILISMKPLWNLMKTLHYRVNHSKATQMLNQLELAVITSLITPLWKSEMASSACQYALMLLLNYSNFSVIFSRNLFKTIPNIILCFVIAQHNDMDNLFLIFCFRNSNY